MRHGRLKKEEKMKSDPCSLLLSPKPFHLTFPRKWVRQKCMNRPSAIPLPLFFLVVPQASVSPALKSPVISYGKEQKQLSLTTEAIQTHGLRFMRKQKLWAIGLWRSKYDLRLKGITPKSNLFHTLSRHKPVIWEQQNDIITWGWCWRGCLKYEDANPRALVAALRDKNTLQDNWFLFITSN